MRDSLRVRIRVLRRLLQDQRLDAWCAVRRLYGGYGLLRRVREWDEQLRE